MQWTIEHTHCHLEGLAWWNTELAAYGGFQVFPGSSILRPHHSSEIRNAATGECLMSAIVGRLLVTVAMFCLGAAAVPFHATNREGW